MRYTVVKQFSNGVIDNIFSFIFKWVDCGKMFVEFLWSFLEIWIAFFLIFYNAFMYVYYLFLFFIDRGAESSAGMFRLRGSYSGSSTIPKFEITRAPSSVPPQYGSQVVTKTAEAVGKTAGAVATKTAEAASQTLNAFRSGGSAAARGVKQSFFKELLSALVDFFKFIGGILAMPFKKLVLLFDRGKEKRNMRQAESDSSKSLIDEYIKEYEQKRR
ncbi:MAG: hypothetical protein KA369_03880 [Spirochaetes bacterium]|nr:hypothetical protein [Spirochaetota bacterium]